MSWNYRVIKKEQVYNWEDGSFENFVSYGIHEVYYCDSGNVVSCTINPVDPYGESIEELRTCLSNMLAALDKPVLDYNIDIPHSADNEENIPLDLFDETGVIDDCDGC